MHLEPNYCFISSHNDLAYAIRQKFTNHLNDFDLDESTAAFGWHTDIPRLRQGKVGAQVI